MGLLAFKGLISSGGDIYLAFEGLIWVIPEVYLRFEGLLIRETASINGFVATT